MTLSLTLIHAARAGHARNEVTLSLLRRAKAAGFTAPVVMLDTFLLGWRPPRPRHGLPTPRRGRRRASRYVQPGLHAPTITERRRRPSRRTQTNAPRSRSTWTRSTRVSRRETCRRCEGCPRARHCRVELRYVPSRPGRFQGSVADVHRIVFLSFVLCWQVGDRSMVLLARLVPSRRSTRHRGFAAPRKKASSRTGSDVIKGIAMCARGVLGK